MFYFFVHSISRGVSNMPRDRAERPQFEMALKVAILSCIDDMSLAENAGALRWFTLLISGTSTLGSQAAIAETSVRLLLNVTKEIAQRWNPNTSILRTRFGLYGLPFEPHLFDAELPLTSKCTALPSSLAAIVKNCGAAAQQQNSVIDLKKFCSAGMFFFFKFLVIFFFCNPIVISDGTEFRTFPSQIRRKGISNQLRGLLEVEPLHFTCSSASEATRIENMDAETNQLTNVIEDILFDGHGGQTSTPLLQPAGVSNAVAAVAAAAATMAGGTSGSTYNNEAIFANYVAAAAKAEGKKGGGKVRSAHTQ